MNIIDIKNLTVKFNETTILEDISFSIKRGEYVAIVGPNGAGKTTLIKTLLGLIDKKFVKGEISINTKQIGYLQQKIFLNNVKFPSSAMEIIKSGLIINKRFPWFYNKNDAKKLEYILELLNINELKQKKISNLSGGELQKVLLARALISNPEIIFLDEPTAALDPLSREYFYNLLKNLNEIANLTILLVSHDIGSVGKYAKKLLYLDRRLIFFGTFEEFCKSKEMTKVFGNISQHFICQRHN